MSKTRQSRLLPLGALVFSSLYLNTTVMAAETLPTIHVRGETVNDKNQPEPLLIQKTQVGKFKQNPHQIPQAITSVPKRLLEDQQAHSLKDALSNNVSGLSFNAAEGGRAGDNMMLRGFYTYGDMYLDGIRDTAQYNRETFNLEQVDVLRGTAAMLFGRGQAGGVINQVSKVPQLINQTTIDTSIGSYQAKYIAADINQSLTQTAAVRINLMSRSESSWRNNPTNGQKPHIDRQGIAPTLRWGIGTDNEWTLSHYHLKTKDIPDYGIRFGADKKPNTDTTRYVGLAGNFDQSETNLSTLTNLNKIDTNWQLSTKIRHGDYQRTYWACAPTENDGCSSKTRDSSTKNTSLQIDSQYTQEWGDTKHVWLFGADYLLEDAKRFSLRNLGTTTNPFYTTVSSGAATTYEGKTLAFYVQDSIYLTPQWLLTLGLRNDHLKATYSNTNSPRLTFRENSYRSAISWMPTDTQHYYLSFSDSFSPTADLYQLSGATYPAERSGVYELGAKWLLLDGDIALRAALYRATKEWERNTDVESTAAILTKKRHTNGFELEMSGRINEQWEVFTGLSLIKAAIDEVAPNANPHFAGQLPRNTPEKTFNLWTVYQFKPDWKIGFGLEGKSQRLVYNPSSTTVASFNPNIVPGYVRPDVMLRYEKEKMRIDFLVKNVTNKTYFDSVYDNGGFVIPGEMRRYSISLSYKI
jgi:catecholate siderophore receptor